VQILARLSKMGFKMDVTDLEKEHDKYEKQIRLLALKLIAAQLDHKTNTYNEVKQRFLDKLERINGKQASE
jgi:hypothetical protein